MLKRSITVLGLALLLTACDFHLRGTGSTQMALTELNFASRDDLSPLSREVKQSLINNKVLISSSAPFTLYLGLVEQSRRTASFTPGTRTAEYQLTSAATYELRSGSLPALLQDRVEVQRFYAFNHNNVAGSSQEEMMLHDEMRRELVTQLMMRLQAITPEQLQDLKEQAERTAQAEAQAREESIRARQIEQPQQSPIVIP